MIQVIIAGLGAWIGYFIGEVNGLVMALILFVVVDYITGVMVAITNKKLSSQIGFKGIFKKVAIFMLVGMANILDTQVLKTGYVLKAAVLFFYLSNEGISILENSAHLGLPIPERLKNVLEQLHKKEVKHHDNHQI